MTPRTKTCGCCRGTGTISARIQNLGTRDFEWHIIECQIPGCHRGIVDLDKNYAAFCVANTVPHFDPDA